MGKSDLYYREYRFCFHDSEADETFYRWGHYTTTFKAKDYARHILSIYKNVDTVTISKVCGMPPRRICKVVKVYWREDLMKVKSVKSR